MSGGQSPVVRVDGFDQFVEVGRGGASIVYAARQIGLDRVVAVKVFQVPMDDPATRRRFTRECSALGKTAELPGFVDVYAIAFTDDGRGCVVMRLMKESLADELVRSGPLRAERVRDIGVACAAALQLAHDQGVVHRDVKPANLLVSESGEIALADFDVAAVEHLVATTTVEALSPPHAAPERLSGEVEVGPAADIWALGSTLFALLEGAPPFGSVSSPGGMAGLVDRVRHDPVPPLASLGSPSGDDFTAVLHRALEKHPADRWPSASDFGAALAGLDLTRVDAEREDQQRGPAANVSTADEPTADPGVVAARLRAVAQGGAGSESADAPTPRGRSIGTMVFVVLVVLMCVVIAVLLALR